MATVVRNLENWKLSMFPPKNPEAASGLPLELGPVVQMWSQDQLLRMCGDGFTGLWAI